MADHMTPTAAEAPAPGCPFAARRPAAGTTGARTLAEIPALPGGGLLGHMNLFRRDPMVFLRALAGGGDLFRLDFIAGSAVVVTAPRLVQEVLVDNARSFEKTAVLRYLLNPVLGDGIFTCRDAQWRRQRKLMAPFFQLARLPHYAGTLEGSVRRTLDTWHDGAVIDALRECTRISMAIASGALFGADTFFDSDEVAGAVATLQAWTTGQMAAPLPVLQGALSRGLERLGDRVPGRAGALLRGGGARLAAPLLLLGEESRRVRGAVAVLDRCVQRMIDERRTSGARRQDLLDQLLWARDADGGALSDKQLRDEVMTLLIAGFETTASALAFALWLLAQHPESYRRVQAEADALGRAPRYEDLPHLGYTLQVFKEALRLYPPSAIFSWEAYEDVTIGGHRLPAGTVVFVSPYATHRRADLWPAPERFDPERFTAQAEAERPRHAYLPFGAGPRVCIANHLALNEGALVLAALLRFADLALPPGAVVTPEFQATLRPRGGVPLRVRLRQADGGRY